MNIDRKQALAFRLAGQHIDRPVRLLTAIAACGVQDTPAAAGAALAVHARAGVSLDPADERFVLVNAMRRAPFLVPRADLPIFTTALVPETDAGLKAFVGANAAAEVLEAGLSVKEALDLVARAARDALVDGPLELVPFHQALRERLPASVLPWCRGCESHHVRSGFWRGLGALGVTEMPAKSTWALADPPEMPLEEARKQAARRFLRTHGPATHTELAKWAGCGPAHAKRLLALVDSELAEVGREGRRAWVLTEDLQTLASPPAARGVRLLGGFDPYVAQPDREALVPDAGLRKRMFPAIGRPNVILHDGQLAGLWRARKAGRRLDFELEWLEEEVDLSEELHAVAALRGCDEARVK